MHDYVCGLSANECDRFFDAALDGMTKTSPRGTDVDLSVLYPPTPGPSSGSEFTCNPSLPPGLLAEEGGGKTVREDCDGVKLKSSEKASAQPHPRPSARRYRQTVAPVTT